MLSYSISTPAANIEIGASEYVAALLRAGHTADAQQAMQVQFAEGVRAAINGWPVYDWDPAARRLGYLALAEGLAASDIDLDGFEWDAWADSECSCTPNSVMACPACLDAIEARYGSDIPF